MVDDSHIHIDMSYKLQGEDFINEYNAMITCYYHLGIWDEIGRPRFMQPVSIGMMFEEAMKRRG